jgi:hypothetical protein
MMLGGYLVTENWSTISIVAKLSYFYKDFAKIVQSDQEHHVKQLPEQLCRGRRLLTNTFCSA